MKVPRPPKVGKRMAQNLEKAILLHTFGVQGYDLGSVGLLGARNFAKPQTLNPKPLNRLCGGPEVLTRGFQVLGHPETEISP